MKSKSIFGFCFFILLSPCFSALPAGFVMSAVTTGLTNAITIRFAPDGRMFFLEQYFNPSTGRVRTMSSVTGTLNPTPWYTFPRLP